MSTSGASVMQSRPLLDGKSSARLSDAMKSSGGLLGFLLSVKAGASILVIVLAAFLFYYFLGGADCWSPGVR